MRRFYIFADSEKVETHDFDPSKHQGRKFLYFIEGDSELLLVGSDWIHQHKFLLELYEAKNGLELGTEHLRGAGDIGFGDKPVRSWKSIGFKLETPPELRPRILELLTLPA